MNDKILVSILINNYNYGRFLAEAIDSALNQTYPNTEVVVVDDGSSDNSREVMAHYGERIVPVLKDNGGQGSAFNAGFARSNGEIVCFLDADDFFLPHKVETVVNRWLECPDASLIYSQLQVVDDRGVIDPKAWPYRVWRGDIRTRVERSGGWWPCPPTSGLCCPRAYLKTVFPMPEAEYRICADAYLVGLAPYMGPVLGERSPLGLYRLHDRHYFRSVSDEDPMGYRRKARQSALEFALLRRSLQHMGIPSTISLDDHLQYQRYRRAAGDPVSLTRVARMALACRSLPVSMKARELVKIVLNRV